MNRDRLCLVGILILLCIFSGPAALGYGQASRADASVVIQQIMATALSRCHSEVNGVKKITFVPATNEEFAEVKALGEEAVTPLAKYLDLKPSGFTQLFAVKYCWASAARRR
jgi:hypothetical protein